MPNNRCSDSPRRAVVVIVKNHEVRFEDAPTFDRLPVTCVVSPMPARPPPGSQCYVNSVPEKDGCKCKDGTKDIHEIPDISDHAIKEGYMTKVGFS